VCVFVFLCVLCVILGIEMCKYVNWDTHVLFVYVRV